MAHVLIVTLGPIQDFIAAARRTRDLWFGSWLLSELSKAAAQAMAEECGLDALVFPGISEPGELWEDRPTSVANKIVIRVPEGKDPEAVAGRGMQGVIRRLEWIRDDSFKNIRPLDVRHFDRDRANVQVADLIELAWVSAPERGPAGYATARRRAESLLSARKNTRLWKPVTWGLDVPKSSIDGERESVLHEDLFDRETKIPPDQIRERYGVGPTERLCGVGLLKRHGTRPSTRYGHRFLSTGHLAAWPLYHRTKDLDDPDLEAAWSSYIGTLEKAGVDLAEQEIYQGQGRRHRIFGKYDGSLLFENRLPELFEGLSDAERALREAKLALAQVLKRLETPAPLPYYAILVADGDHMGRAIERQENFQQHQALSKALDRFAREVSRIVETDHQGELVYSGGDDVLALVPLHYAVACARKLAETFKIRLGGFPAGDRETPTLSAGIGVSHFLDPLRGALDLARKAEKLAKEERNSLAVIVDKRSGPEVRVKGKWGTLDLRLDDYVALHRADMVPDGAAYELRELGRLVDGAKDDEKAVLARLVRKEAERILRRKQPKHGGEQKLDPQVLERLLVDLGELSVDVADRLIVARLFAAAADEAGEPIEFSSQEVNLERVAG